MPLYYYKAVNREGSVEEAEREAADEETLLAALHNEGLMPIRIALAASRPFAWLRGRRGRPRLGHEDLALFTRELHTLLKAGLPLDRALNVLLELTETQAALNALIGRVLEAVKGGAQLSDALERQGLFSRFYLNLIRSGEAGGALEQVLQRLSDYLEHAKELRDTVVSALIYPAILVSMAFLSLFLLLTFVVPQFTDMFAAAGKELPLPTRIVVGAAEALRAYWWVVLLGLTALASHVRLQMTDPERRAVWDRRLLKLPLLADLIRKVEVARFSRTLGTLLSNGVPLLAALAIVKETIGNRALATPIDLALESLKQGGSLSAPLIESGQFPILAIQMIKLGEESGRLDEMLERVANTYDKEVKITIQRLLALLEPTLIVGLGILIAGIIIAILMAILSVNDLAF